MSPVTTRAAASLPPAIYLLSLCSFAFGLSEFIAAGLLTPMARDLHASVAAAGGAIAAYALGAAIGAPILTAMLARRPTPDPQGMRNGPASPYWGKAGRHPVH